MTPTTNHLIEFELGDTWTTEGGYRVEELVGGFGGIDVTLQVRDFHLPALSEKAYVVMFEYRAYSREHGPDTVLIEILSGLGGFEVAREAAEAWIKDFADEEARQEAQLNRGELEYLCDRMGVVMKDFPDSMVDRAIETGDYREIVRWVNDGQPLRTAILED